MTADLVQETLELPFWPEGGALDGLCVVLDAAGGGAALPSEKGLEPGGELKASDRSVHLAAQVRHHFSRDGAQVPMVRWDDRVVQVGADAGADARARGAWASEWRAHVFLSLEDAPAGATAEIMAAEWDELARAVGEAMAMGFAGGARVVIGRTELMAATEGVPTLVIRLPRDADRDIGVMAGGCGTHRDEARRLHAGLCRAWESLRVTLEVRRQKNFPGAPVVSVPTPVPAEVIARILWPRKEPPKDAAEADHLLMLLKRGQLSDRTIQRFDARTRKTVEGWVVEGAVSHPRLREAAGGLLKAAGCANVENKVQVLPSGSLGSARFGIVCVPMAMTWVRPREGDDSQTQLRVGECLFLLDRTEDGRWYLVQAEDAYIAWVRSDALLAVEGGTFDAWRGRARARVLRDVLIEGFRIPSGARLPIVEERPECDGVVVELPSLKPGVPGARVLLGEGHAVAEESRGLGELVVQVAMGFLGTPYVWGGRSALGIDCSGFAETCWSAAGVMLPRDAFQQALVGRLVATCWHRTDMRPGDLLFFIDEGGRTFHVAISLGGQRFVHSSPPEVHVISLDPADPLYRQRWVDAFLFARRPLD